ncbi:EVE domain-containing protein [Alsobacter soli]|uniref:EVE domain-containing protein n=1 Tax=Alsobacter soli TaxID=2109933 RepID=A0A2T1HMV7_9HYPH|nr:EVE domain-containing protein [Alsobacter soli]PSC02962.1 EVE domain-containing protein [Alsobacter soli]
MAHWLYKSEPDVYSWDQLVADGDKGTHWNGVRNHLAKINLRTMKLGDRGFFYHSNIGKEIVGIVEVIREAYPDHTAPEGSPWVMVDIKAVEALPRPVPLAAVKLEPRLAKMSLVTCMRLSVQPVTDAEWDVVREMGGL